MVKTESSSGKKHVVAALEPFWHFLHQITESNDDAGTTHIVPQRQAVWSRLGPHRPICKVLAERRGDVVQKLEIHRLTLYKAQSNELCLETNTE